MAKLCAICFCRLVQIQRALREAVKLCPEAGRGELYETGEAKVSKKEKRKRGEGSGKKKS